MAVCNEQSSFKCIILQINKQPHCEKLFKKPKAGCSLDSLQKN